MDLTALIMDKRSKKVKQFSLPIDVEYVALEFGYDEEEELIEIAFSFAELRIGKLIKSCRWTKFICLRKRYWSCMMVMSSL